MAPGGSHPPDSTVESGAEKVTVVPQPEPQIVTTTVNSTDTRAVLCTGLTVLFRNNNRQSEGIEDLEEYFLLLLEAENQGEDTIASCATSDNFLVERYL